MVLLPVSRSALLADFSAQKCKRPIFAPVIVGAIADTCFHEERLSSCKALATTTWTASHASIDGADRANFYSIIRLTLARYDQEGYQPGLATLILVAQQDPKRRCSAVSVRHELYENITIELFLRHRKLRDHSP